MKFALSKTIAAPVDRVFAAMSDFANLSSRIPGIIRVEMLTTGPVAVGTKFKETRKMFGKESTETMEVTAFEPVKRYELSADSCGVHIRTEFLFTPDAGGTRIDMTMTSQPKTFMTKLMTPLFGWMMKGMMKKIIMSDLDSVEKSLAT